MLSRRSMVKAAFGVTSSRMGIIGEAYAAKKAVLDLSEGAAGGYSVFRFG